MVSRRRPTKDDESSERRLISNQLYVALLKYGSLVRGMACASKCRTALEKFNELDRQIMEMIDDDKDFGKSPRRM